MIVLLFTLILLLAIIALGQLNPGAITINLFGLVIRNVPISVFMLIFIILGILLTAGALGTKYYRIKKKYNALASAIGKLQEKEEDHGNSKGNSGEGSLQESGE